jgi:hypothetical protein
MIVTGSLVTACKKDSQSNNSNASSDDSLAAKLSVSSATSGTYYDDALTVVAATSVDNGIEQAATGVQTGRTTVFSSGSNPLNGNISGSCAVYAFHTTNGSFPDTVWANFGGGCKSADSITRSGEIEYIFSGRLLTPGTTVSASFNQYTVNGYTLEGTYSITNTSTQNGLSWSTSVANGKITFPDASWYTYSGHKTVTQEQGASTPLNFSDDVYNIVGKHTCASSAGQSLTDTTTTPLVKATACTWIQSGVLSFTYNDISGTLDFGDGTCDDHAIVKVGLFSEPVILP